MMIEPSIMYSLYQSWVTQASPDASAPPDLLLDIGGTHFAVHSTLLAEHSGYIRAALYARQTVGTVNIAPLVISNISPEQFAPLLAYMYSGNLELTTENIFTVLLATHILQIPKALELCREFMALNNFLPDIPYNNIRTTRGVIKPTPSRNLPSTSTIPGITPTNHSVFNLSRDTSFHPPNNLRNKVEASSVASSTSEWPEIKQKTNYFQTLKVSKSKTLSQDKSNDQQSQQNNTNHQIVSEKIIIDIASCDGPVRFSRVLNQAYNGEPTNNSYADKVKEGTRDIAGASFNMQMAENIRNFNLESSSVVDEDNSSEEINVEDINPSETTYDETKDKFRNGETLYVCMHCKHTFKSQYCYQKHARRHLHPVESNEQMDSKKNQEGFDRKKIKISPFDMNVQYYPCKICGSKFPSYYFVHKHRKMCHSENNNQTI